MNPIESGWGIYKGDVTYKIGGINEYNLLTYMISNSCGRQKKFTLLDIGAGNFQLINYLAPKITKFLKKKKMNDIHVTFIGVRCENNFINVVTKNKYVTVHRIGAVRIEHLCKELKKRGFDLKNKVNLCISRWCFRHLTDPVGTFRRTYKLLSSDLNICLIDGFFFLYGDENIFDIDYCNRMRHFFKEVMKMQMISIIHREKNTLDQYVVRKVKDTVPALLTYVDRKMLPFIFDVNSETVIQFDRASAPRESTFCYDSTNNKVTHGDFSLYYELYCNNVLRHTLRWQPLKILHLPSRHKTPSSIPKTKKTTREEAEVVSQKKSELPSSKRSKVFIS